MTNPHAAAIRPGRRSGTRRAPKSALFGCQKIGLALAVALATLLVGSVTAPTADAAPSRINGAGSSYVALAMQQWVADGQTSGLQVNYLPTGAPQGLQSFGQSLVDFGASEAEFSALQATGGETVRGYQYVPDVAGATAVLYNVDDKAGREVDYLHLSRRTIARIFTGEICKWSDPAISADNKGLALPDQDIKVVYRAGQSGQTGTFYDFIKHVAPDIFNPWAAKHQLPTNVRIIQLDSAPNFACKTQAFHGSDQIAQYVGNQSGKWSISYNEFGYAKVYHANSAWVQNASGQWVMPYAENISAALENATLRPDLSQELSGVYDSMNPKAYPISAYSYLITQCKQSADRPTCKGEYANPGIAETLEKWMRYIACEGQINMARIGYSPLPPNLSQELVNSIARLQGKPGETLNAGNCANPRFKGSLGADSSSPPDPLAKVTSIGGGAGGGSSGGAKSTTQGGAGAAGAGAAAGGAKTKTTVTGSTTPGATTPDAAADPAAEAAAGGSAAAGDAAAGEGAAAEEIETAAWRPASPVYSTKARSPFDPWLPTLVLVAILVVPPIGFGLRRRRRGA